MLKYAKIINKESGLVEVGLGTNEEFYQSIGMTELDVQLSDIDGQWYLTEKCPMKTDEQKEQAEHERIALLNMTGADVERAIYKVKGIDFDDILAKVKDNPTIDEKALKIEFKANNFFRGNPYIEQVGALLGFTSKQLDKFFETKDYTYLIPSEQVSDQVTDIVTEQVEVQDENTTDYNESDIQDELDTTNEDE